MEDFNLFGVSLSRLYSCYDDKDLYFEYQFLQFCYGYFTSCGLKTHIDDFLACIEPFIINEIISRYYKSIK